MAMTKTAHARWGVALGLLLSILVTQPRSVVAQSLSPAAAQAKAQFERGQKAVADGDLRRARALFIASNQMFPATGTVLNLADCEEQLQLHATALRHYREALLKLGVGDPRVVFTRARIAALEPVVPRLKVTLAPNAPRDSRVLLDSRELPRESVGTEMLLDPGKYTVTVAANGRVERAYPVTLASKKKVSITVEPGPLSPITAVPSTEVSESPKSNKLAPPQQDRGLVMRGVGSYVLALGVAGGVAAFNTRLLDRDPYALAGSGADDAGVLIMGVGLGAASLLIGAGVTLLVVGQMRRGTSVSLGASPSSAQVNFAARF